jgi:hypothetical protein
MTGNNALTWPKITCGVAIAAVAVAAGWISYTHIYELTLALHQSRSVARLMPIGVDGLITIGSIVLLQDGGLLGWAGIIPGVVISVFANVESGIRYGALAAIWAGIPAVSFFTACFILERWLAKQARSIVPEAVPAMVPETVPAVLPVRAPRRASEVIFAAEISRRELPTLREVKTRARCGTDRARIIRDQLAQLMQISLQAVLARTAASALPGATTGRSLAWGVYQVTGQPASKRCARSSVPSSASVITPITTPLVNAMVSSVNLIGP